VSNALARAGGASRAGFSAPVSTKRNVFGAARFVPGLQGSPYFFDSGRGAGNGGTAAPINATTDIPIPAGLQINQPMVVVTMRAAGASKATSAGTITVSLVRADNSLAAFSATTTVQGSNAGNFLMTWHVLLPGSLAVNAKAIRIVSATADASTTLFYRAAIWRFVAAGAGFAAASTAGGHPPVVNGPFASAVAGAPSFNFADAWSGSSASKGVTWNSPTTGNTLTMPGKTWMARSFTIASGGTYPMACSLASCDGPASTYQCAMSISNADWIDFITQAGQQSWGIGHDLSKY
jgi:hypothetical protein